MMSVKIRKSLSSVLHSILHIQMSTFPDSKGKFDMIDTPSTFLRYSHLIDIYTSADRNVRSDLIFSHTGVVSWIYVEDSILQKVFLPTKITNFRERLKTTVVTVCGSCSSPTPIKVHHRHLFSDIFRFSSGYFHNIFPSVPVGDFLQKVHRSDPNTYSDLPRDL